MRTRLINLIYSILDPMILWYFGRHSPDRQGRELILNPLSYNVQQDGLRIRVAFNSIIGEVHLNQEDIKSICKWNQLIEDGLYSLYSEKTKL